MSAFRRRSEAPQQSLEMLKARCRLFWSEGHGNLEDLSVHLGALPDDDLDRIERFLMPAKGHGPVGQRVDSLLGVVDRIQAKRSTK